MDATDRSRPTSDRSWLLVVAIPLALFGDPLEARSLAPKDECSADRSFDAFRAELLQAVLRKDRRYLLSVVSPDVKTSLGPGGEGRASFVKTWKLDQADVSPVWDELNTILRLGCAQSTEGMAAPYLFSRFPDDLDPVESLIVVKPNGVLRAAPHRTARPTATLPLWEIVSRAEPGRDTEKWVAVRTSSGRSGFVEARALRSPLDYRAVFGRAEDRWTLTYLIAGD